MAAKPSRALITPHSWSLPLTQFVVNLENVVQAHCSEFQSFQQYHMQTFEKLEHLMHATATNTKVDMSPFSHIKAYTRGSSSSQPSNTDVIDSNVKDWGNF